MKPTLQYISHGLSPTGGYYHESTLAQTLAQQIHGNAATYREVRFNRNFKGPLGWLLLFVKTFLAADSNAVVITVARLAWPVRFKQLFGKGKMLLVLHNYDPRDAKPALYYRLLNAFLKYSTKRKSRIRVVVVARCWQAFFEKQFAVKSYLFPNLFPAESYQFFRSIAKKNSRLIHLGEFSEKSDVKKYLILLHKLKEYGFTCYFSSNKPEFKSHLPISFFNTREAYLKQMACSGATVIINRVDEGWNRVAHESILLGTPVLVMAGGGVAELADQLGGIPCHSVDEIINTLQSTLPPAEIAKTAAFETSTAPQWAQPLLEFIQEQ